jgi:hypothetical protein
MAEGPDQYTARILGHLQGRDPLRLMASAADVLAGLIQGLPDATLNQRPAPGKWSIREIVAHLADDELVGAYRIRLILSNPGTPIQAFDQDVWAVTGRYQEMAMSTALELFRVLRAANLALFSKLTTAEWAAAGIHAERGRESIRDIARYYAGHDLTHFAQIRACLSPS